MGITDYHRTMHNFEKPLFSQVIVGNDDGGSGHYIGIGYSINITGDFLSLDESRGVIKAYFYILDVEISYVKRD